MKRKTTQQKATSILWPLEQWERIERASQALCLSRTDTVRQAVLLGLPVLTRRLTPEKEAA